MRTAPEPYTLLYQRSLALGFAMPAAPEVGQLLRTLVAAKPGGRILELGTGMGLSLAWMIAGMNDDARLLTVDNDADLLGEVRKIITDARVELLLADGDDWLHNYEGPPFDLIFADTWPGKYRLLEETLALLKVGGIYVVDDMLEQENWPEGHAEKAATLRQRLIGHPSLCTTAMDWGTGVIVGTKVQVGKEKSP